VCRRVNLKDHSGEVNTPELLHTGAVRECGLSAFHTHTHTHTAVETRVVNVTSDSHSSDVHFPHRTTLPQLSASAHLITVKVSPQKHQPVRLQ
jgi:hypothetical protein